MSGAAALAVCVGCSGSPAPRSHHHNVAAADTVSPRQALRLALDQGQQDRSAVGTLDVQVTGTSSSTSTGTMQMQFKPKTLISTDTKVKTPGGVVSVSEIDSGDTTYLKLASLKAATGKPWAKVTYSPGKGTPQVGARGLANADPLRQAQLLLIAKHIHTAGTQVIDGVTTTVYQGSYPAAAALQGLPPGVRKEAQQVKTHGQVEVTIWVDAQHHLRQMRSTEHVGKETLTITVQITAVNVPLHIAVPPASQVAVLPKGALGGV